MSPDMFILLTALSIPAEVVQRSGGGRGGLALTPILSSELLALQVNTEKSICLISYTVCRQSHIDWLGYTNQSNSRKDKE